MASSLSSSARFFLSSFSMRAFSFSRSTSSARGMNSRAAWVVTVTMPWAVMASSLPASATPSTVTSLA